MPAQHEHRRGPVRRLYTRLHRVRRVVRSAKTWIVYAAVRTVLFVLGLLSLDQALALADRAGDLMYYLFRGNRRLAREHLVLAIGDQLTPAGRDRIIRASFRNIMRCFVELVKFDTIRAQFDEYVDIEGFENIQAALAIGRGAIAITGHIGNWELLGAYIAHKGIPVAAVARRVYDSRLNRLLVDFRTRNGVRTILRESPSSSREILAILREKGVLALVIDQDMNTPSVSAPFFGRMARTPAAAAALALRKDLPVFAAFAQRRPGGGHRLTLLPAFSFAPTGDRPRDILALTRLFNQTLEDRVRKNPVEWVWWHRRWRRGPTPRLDLDAKV